MWALPGVHPSNIEILQQLKTADTNHFTTNMNCVGTVQERDPATGSWGQTHLVGIRTDVWKPDEKELGSAVKALQEQRRLRLKAQIKRSGRLSAKQNEELQRQLADDEVMQLASGDILSRRLVLKLFKTTGERLRWVGTLEQVTTSEVHNSLGSRRPLLSLAAMLPRTQMLTHIQQNHRTFRVPSIFTSCFYEKERMWSLQLRRRWIALAPYYDIQVDNQTIGQIDCKLISFGCDSYLNLTDHPLTGETRFVDLLTLFACSIGYHRSMRRSVRRRVKATIAGESYRHVIEDEEIRLRHNGRAAA